MDLVLDGYRIERLLRSASVSQVWAATRERDQLPVVVKAFQIDGSAELEARVRHEFELIVALDLPGVVRALSLERSGRQVVLVLEAYPGVNLSEYADGRALPVASFLAIAEQIVAILSEVHQRRVLHRDLKPTNVLIEPESGVVALADFGISVLLDSERGHIHDPSVIEGTLPYMAPEQTGRTEREVDFRSDLYSLGVTFYELLTGHLPFVSDSPLELIHAHFAKQAPPPRHVRPELPAPVSALVMKLLEKAPERRYQSAQGLLADLRSLRDELGRGGIPEDFVLGNADASTTLQLPHQLYGREPERKQLHAAFVRASTGPPEFVVVSGPSGIGKSALLDELVGAIIARRGFLARGKFDEESARPFSAIITAVASVVDQLLTQSPEHLATWRERLRAALDGFGPVICELVPHLRAVLGEVPAKAELPPIEARNQVMLAFSRLLSELARPEHPLVLALDDVQWIDAASVTLLDTLIADRDAALLVVATARPSALEPGSRFDELLSKLEVREIEPTSFELAPLGPEQLCAMIADVLSQPVEAVAPLAQIVARKTGSNPFFARQFLLLLAERGLLERAPEGWRWDLRALERATLPEDALEMMVAKIGGLDPTQRELICVASVFGSQFEPLAVERVTLGRSTMPAFGRLIEEGLISPLPGRGLLFAHDRIREAAYALLGPDRQRALHLAVGEVMLERHADLSTLESSAEVFEVADHLDRGYGLLGLVHEPEAQLAQLDDARLEQLASVNLFAGQRALTSGAPQAAHDYLGVAARLLAQLEPFPARGQPRRELHFEVLLTLGQAAALIEAHEESEACSSALLTHDLSPRELGRAAVARAWQLAVAGEHLRALELGLETLRELGVALPRRVRMVHVLTALPTMLRLAQRVDIEQVAAREPIDDARMLAAIDVIMAVNAGSYISSPETFVLLVERHATMIADHGDHPTAPLALSLVGLVLASGLGKRSECVTLTRKCLASIDARAVHNPVRNRVLYSTVFSELWTRNPLELAADNAEILQRALELGDIETASGAWTMRLELSYFGGLHLRVLADLIEQRLRWAKRWGVTSMQGTAKTHAANCERLMAGPAPPLEAKGNYVPKPPLADAIVELDALSRAIEACLVLAVFGRWHTLLPIIRDIGPRLQRAAPGLWAGDRIPLLWGLAASAVSAAPGTSPAEARRLRRRLRRHHRALEKKVAAGGHFAYAERMLRAELSPDYAESSRLFAEARALATKERNPIFEALASERAAAHALARGLGHHAEAALRDARASYLRWGAFAKVAELDANGGPRVLPEPPRTPSGETSSIGSSSTTSKALDGATLLEVSQAIAEDIRLDEVIARVLRLAVENAGADRGVLVLSTDGLLEVAADYVPEHKQATLLAEPLPLTRAGDRVPAQLLRWVARTNEPVVISEFSEELRFVGDPYLSSAGARSILCAPIVKHGVLIGLLYLENKLSAGAFTSQRLETLRLLAAQAGNALENARLYDDLRVSEIRWRSLVEQMPDHVALAQPDGTIEAVNSGHRAGRRGFELDAHREEVEGALRRVFETGAQQELELHLQPEAAAADTFPRDFIVRLAPISIDGTIDRALLVATDVSERRRAQAERARLENQVRQQQRLESIGTLASGVAHEINNPVHGIMGYAELISSSAAADEDIRELTREIQRETQRVTAIVRNLLAFSRQEQDEPMLPTRVEQIVEGTVSLIRAVLRKDHIALELSIEPELPELSCRSQQIQQVVMNLVTNARDALNTRYPGHDAAKRVDLRASSFSRESQPWVRISVEDRGGGVPPELVARIFDPFFTTKGRDEGTGLGLAISHGIVTDHGGELRLDNRIGEGACFSVELPARPRS